MKFVQLIADTNGSLRWGLDAAGNIWKLYVREAWKDQAGVHSAQISATSWPVVDSDPEATP